MKKAILFDLDGTLVNSLYDLCDGANYMLNKLGMPNRTMEEIRTFVGNGIDMLVRRAVCSENYDFKEAMGYFKEYYNENLCRRTRPYDGIINALCVLSEKGFNLSVVTNKPQYVAEKIVKHFFDGYFDIVVGADTEKRRKKPEPDGVDTALGIIGVTRSEAIYVGDSEVDIETAKRADMDFIGAAWGFRNEEIFVNEKWFVRNAQELISLCCNFL